MIKVKIVNENIGDTIAAIPALIRLSQTHGVIHLDFDAPSVRSYLKPLLINLPFYCSEHQFSREDARFVVDIQKTFDKYALSNLHMVDAIALEMTGNSDTTSFRRWILIHHTATTKTVVLSPYSVTDTNNNKYVEYASWVPLLEYMRQDGFEVFVLGSGRDKQIWPHSGLFTPFYGHSTDQVVKTISNSTLTITVDTATSHLIQAMKDDVNHLLLYPNITMPTWVPNRNKSATNWIINAKEHTFDLGKIKELLQK